MQFIVIHKVGTSEANFGTVASNINALSIEEALSIKFARLDPKTTEIVAAGPANGWLHPVVITQPVELTLTVTQGRYVIG